jgi:hypothetical protein
MRTYSNRLPFDSLSRQERFSECYKIFERERILSPEDTKHIFLKAVEEVNFAEEDDCLAELVKLEMFTVLLSPNVDELLENAFIAADMEENHNFLVLSRDYHDPQQVLFQPRRASRKLIKIQGDVNTLAYNIRRHLQDDNRQYLESLLEKMQTEELFVVGLDPVWDHGIITALPPGAKTIWLANEDKAVKDLLVKHYEHVEQIKYVDSDYKQFFTALYTHINRVPRDYALTIQVRNQLRVLQQEVKDLKHMHQDIKQILDYVKEIRQRH